MVKTPSSDSWSDTIYTGRGATRRCPKCNHRWNIHRQVQPTLKGFEIKMVCDGEAFPCNCVKDYYEEADLIKEDKDFAKLEEENRRKAGINEPPVVDEE